MISITGHAVHRFIERHGHEPTQGEVDQAVTEIIDGRSLLLVKREDGTEDHMVGFGDLRVRVIYAPQTATIITVLPGDGQSAWRQVEVFKKTGQRANKVSSPRYFRGRRVKRLKDWV